MTAALVGPQPLIVGDRRLIAKSLSKAAPLARSTLWESPAACAASLRGPACGAHGGGLRVTATRPPTASD